MTDRTGLARPPEVAEYLGMSVAALATQRYRGDGPAYVRLSARAIRYRWEDVDAWLRERETTTPARVAATA